MKRTLPSPASSLARGPPEDGVGFPIVAIGASAGGLEACKKLISALPADTGMAFILVQHLDPTHASMMVALLAQHAAIDVSQVTEGMIVEPDHFYVIPPGSYIAFEAGALRMTQPQAGAGIRLPFDFLLLSLAQARGAGVFGIVLSGTGTDGSLGLKALKENGGKVFAQDPDEASYGDMPRNAIKTGAVDFVLPAAQIARALLKFKSATPAVGERSAPVAANGAEEGLPEILALLQTKTSHEFKLYKPGTLQRRIERRMSMAAIKTMAEYLTLLRGDENELDLLDKDLLINVTSFFRDPRAFAFIAEKVVPDLVRDRGPERPVRIWVPGCSTGEEAYSLAMLFREEIAKAKRDLKLQMFASDIDADAVAIARAGFYPEAVKADISPERLARFFAHEELGYRVLPELSSSIVFTTHDVLTDPPFSKLDMVSCRNLLIYLGREAQEKAISLFHFALGDGGILFLGNSESAGSIQGRFEVISKSERVYRHIGRARPGELGFLMKNMESTRSPPRAGQSPAPTRLSDVAEYSRRLLIDNFAPAAALITRDGELLYSLGPLDRYLRVAPGLPAQDVLAMARDDVRTKLRSAIQKACRENARVVVKGGRLRAKGGSPGFRIEVLPVQREGKDLLFVGFLDEMKPVSRAGRASQPGEPHEVTDLKQELAETQTELHDAILNLEESNEEQKAINEDALSVNEEFQSTNEELLTSKEELQSLNEELTALNAQLQETLERQRTTANDLQNVLYSTDVATLFLDAKLDIRFFTPATKALFNVIPGDVGRPLADLKGLAADVALLTDAQTVLKTLTPVEREIQTQAGEWYSRRILPYRAQEQAGEGVVITFNNVTERKRAADALEAAKRQADQANKAKSRFLAAASHDLRQPLQSMTLIQAFLEKHVMNEKARKYVTRLDGALNSMSGMLNTLLEINQIEAGTIKAESVAFPINEILERMRDEFDDHAEAKRLRLRVVPSALVVQSDPRLLEQMMRNLLANALKFTKVGKVLLGCRRRKGMVSIEIWDSGIGIPAAELQAIFDEYHQIGNEAREAGRGFGLGLAIVKRLGDMLGHPVRVHSRPGKGSAFAIEVVLAPVQVMPIAPIKKASGDMEARDPNRTKHEILVVEDDPEMRELLEMLLGDAGYGVATASDGFAALELVVSGAILPDIILSDYNLPLGMNGLQVATSLREKLNRAIPVIILTGDISTESLRKIALLGCAQLRKPVKADELTEVIQEQLNLAAAGTPSA